MPAPAPPRPAGPRAVRGRCRGRAGAACRRRSAAPRRPPRPARDAGRWSGLPGRCGRRPAPRPDPAATGARTRSAGSLRRTPPGPRRAARSSWRRPGWGCRSAASVPVSSRSTPSSRRISVSAARAVSPIAAAAALRPRAARGGQPGRLGLHRDHGDVVRDHVVQLAGDPGPFAAGCVLEQGARDDLPGRAVLARLAARPARDPGQAAAGASAGQQERQILGADARRDRPGPSDQERQGRAPPPAPVSRGGQPVHADQLRDQAGDGERLEGGQRQHAAPRTAPARPGRPGPGTPSGTVVARRSTSTTSTTASPLGRAGGQAAVRARRRATRLGHREQPEQHACRTGGAGQRGDPPPRRRALRRSSTAPPTSLIVAAGQGAGVTPGRYPAVPPARDAPARSSPGAATAKTAPRRDDRQRAPLPSVPAWKQLSKSSGLRKRFGPTAGPGRDVLHRRAGQVTGFVGPNGAGKSTTMRVILGLDAADEGTALIGGRPYAQPAPPAQPRRRAAGRGRAAAQPQRPQPPAVAGPLPGPGRPPGRRGDRAGRACRRRPGARRAATRWACGSGSASPPRCSATRRC